MQIVLVSVHRAPKVRRKLSLVILHTFKRQAVGQENADKGKFRDYQCKSVITLITCLLISL